MVTFKQFLVESKFAHVPEEYVSKVTRDILEFGKTYRVGTPSENIAAYRRVCGTRKIFVSRLRVFDRHRKEERQIKVYLKLGYNFNASFYDKTGEILINPEYMLSASSANLAGIIKHELRHAVQEYKTFSDKYWNAVEKMGDGDNGVFNDYYFEPGEFEAHATALAHTIEADIMYSYNRNSKISLRTGKHFLKYHIARYKQLLTNPWSVYKRGKKGTSRQLLPTEILKYYEFLDTVSQNPVLWKKLKSKLYDLLENISQKHSQTLE